MKRLVILLLLLTLLSGCTAVPKETTVPLTTAYIPPQSEQTAGGVTVQTDYSAYAPSAGTPEIYTRISEDFIDSFTPSDDYGAIYPFCGSLLYESLSGGYVYAMGAKYGLVTEGGQIVCDPVYSDVTRGCYYDQNYHPTYYPVWLLTENHFQSASIVSLQNYEYETTLVALDGSWVSEHTYRFVRFCGDDILAMRYDDRVVDLLDLNGNILFSTETMDGALELAKDHIGTDYAEGLFVLGEQPGLWSDEINYYYVDRNGDIVLGPYDSASAFSEGYAVVSDDGNSFYYIDREGDRLNDVDYTDCEPFYDGLAIANVQSGETQILNLRGECVKSFPAGASVFREENGFRVYENGARTYYDEDLQLRQSVNTEELQLFVDGGDLFLRYFTNGKGFEVIRGPEQEVVFTYESEHFNSVSRPEWTGEGGESYFVIYEYDDESETATTRIYDLNYQEMLATTGLLRALTDDGTGEIYFCVPEGRALKVYDYEMKLCHSVPWSRDYEEYDAIKVYDGKLFLHSHTESLIYDTDGTLIFRYRMPSWYGD